MLAVLKGGPGDGCGVELGNPDAESIRFPGADPSEPKGPFSADEIRIRTHPRYPNETITEGFDRATGGWKEIGRFVQIVYARTGETDAEGRAVYEFRN